MSNRSQTQRDSEVLLSYKGNVTDDLFNCLLELAEHKLNQEHTPTKVKKKVFKVMVESLQNVYHHFDDFPFGKDLFSVSFSLQKDKLTYAVLTGNHISIDKVDKLRSLIDKINAMSRQELQVFYRDRLSKGQISEQGGAGLGIVDIIRKSGEKITYKFKPVNRDYSYFSLKVKVSA